MPKKEGLTFRPFEKLLSKEDGRSLEQKINDPTYLPTFQELLELFPVLDLSKKITEKEDSKFRDFIQNPNYSRFEILNQEFIGALGNHLSQSGNRILELGAGDGRLSHFIKEYFEKNALKKEYYATDTKEWEIENPKERSHIIKPIYPVEKLDNESALKKYAPDLVLVSWMPPTIDFTASIRRQKSVKEYVLVGHSGEDICGKTWETWGNTSFTGHSDDETPPYKEDGFVMTNHPEISKYQICRNSNYRWMVSDTISFKRQE